jgi:hypothetical protein
LKAYAAETPEDDRAKTFIYIFDTTTAPGQTVTVDFALHLRHLPPYFLNGLDGLYPDNLTGETLLKQMVVSTAAVAKVTSKRMPQV